MNKKWIIKPRGNSDSISALAGDLNINPILSNLLVQRGHDTFEKAKAFFRPALNMLHDPFLMKDMDKAVKRIEKAISNGEKILIYGDYDVDGTTSVALFYLFLKQRYQHIDYYIPDRYLEGYGVSTRGIDWAHQNNCTLIVAFDCGIKSNDKVDYARSLGIDFIIGDHHRPGDTLPAAVAVLDPKRDDCNYPFKELSGCGVAFKLACALCVHNGWDIAEAYTYLDLVAISIAADIVPIVDENRVLTYFGLKQINSSPRPGIKAILEISGKKGVLDVNDVVFTIAPRINAAGRIESAKQAVQLLLCESAEEARWFGTEIDKKNSTRKNLNENMTRDAMSIIREDPHFASRKSTVLYYPDWHKGVLGIVASKLTDEYYRPTVILSKSNGMAAGSARSVKDFDIYNALESCSDLLEQFGGHMYAAGLTLKEENVEAFKERFEFVVQSTIEERMLVKEIEIDDELSFTDLNLSFVNVLKQFGPFGPGNMAPVFMTKRVFDPGSARKVGTNHLKMALAQQELPRVIVDSIAFQLGHFFDQVKSSQPFDVCYHVEENNFNGRINLQLNVKDIRKE
jgi:single-stranded-DNA-specific exonuclease